jgi:uridylate kinase
MAESGYRRVLLKLSGEAHAGGGHFGIDAPTLTLVAEKIAAAHAVCPEMAIVVGAGNFLRGTSVSQDGGGMQRVTADYAGMLATVINSLALQDSLERVGLSVRIQSAIDIQRVAEPYFRRQALQHLAEGRIVIFAAGTGNPYMTTDTAAALRAIEIEAQALLMVKNKVDGVYEADPAKDAEARRFETLSYLDALSRRLKVMDSTALTLCLEHNLPIVVFDLLAPESIARAARGEKIGTLVGDIPTAMADSQPSPSS